MSRFRIQFGAAWVLVGFAAAANAQMAHTQTTPLPYSISSGSLDNPSGVEQVVFDQIVGGGDVPWLRLSFAQAQLNGGSYLMLYSLFDGAIQKLDATAISQWQNYSAYFNGSEVRILLMAAPHSAGNRVDLQQLDLGAWAPGDNVATQCGTTDDRVASNERSRGRLLNVGCTASIYNHVSGGRSCMITAGHCSSSPGSMNVLEFNVPLSLSNGTLQHPGPQDQYACDTGTRVFQNGGLGRDWGLFKVFDNSNTGLQPFESQNSMVTLGTSVPGAGTPTNICGFGVDTGTANQTQQIAFGPLTSVSGTIVNYSVDTEGGNSGSCVLNNNNSLVIAVHTNGGCTSTGGSNSGTAINMRRLRLALSSFCTGSPILGDMTNLSDAEFERLVERTTNEVTR